MSAFREASPAEIVASWSDSLSVRDRELLGDERLTTAFAASMKALLRQGPDGGGWDNVAWVGPWEIDLASIKCPVLLVRRRGLAMSIGARRLAA